MSSLIEDLKSEARVLHRRARAGEPGALARLDVETGEPIKRRHCLAAIARELGFAGWPALVSAVEALSRTIFWYMGG